MLVRTSAPAAVSIERSIISVLERVEEKCGMQSTVSDGDETLRAVKEL